MSKGFIENMEHGSRDWLSIVAVDGMLGSAAATAGYAALGTTGLLAAAPLVGNIAKNCFSRSLADLEMISSREGYFCAEVLATAAVATITAVAVTTLTPLGTTYALYAAVAIGVPLLLETVVAQYKTSDHSAYSHSMFYTNEFRNDAVEPQDPVVNPRVLPERLRGFWTYNGAIYNSLNAAMKIYCAINPEIVFF